MTVAVDASIESPLDRKCKAIKKDGVQCGKWAIKGATVCGTHGGSAPQVRRSARARLLELVDPALAELSKILYRTNVLDSDKIKACTAILDRAGYGPNAKLTVEQKGDLRPRVIEMLNSPHELSDKAREAIQVIHTLDTPAEQPALPPGLQSLADSERESPDIVGDSILQDEAHAQALINRTLAHA